MSDLRKDIIEAGYKRMMTESHPDAGTFSQKAEREETCKRLAVARDWLLATVTSSQSRPVRQPQASSYPPTVTQTSETAEIISRALDLAEAVIFGKKPARPVSRPRPTIRRPR